MTAETQRIVDKLAKLRAMAEGAEAVGNEAEAQAFAEMFQRLLTKHKLDMSDIEFANIDKTEPVGHYNIDYSAYPDVRVRANRIAWMELLASIIARAYFCQIVVHPRSSRISLVGRKSDTQVAEYMIIALQRYVDKTSAREAEAFKRKAKANGDRSQGNGFRSAWITGFTSRLSQRLTEAMGAQTTALVRVSKEREANASDPNTGIGSRSPLFAYWCFYHAGVASFLEAVKEFINRPSSGFTKSSTLSTTTRHHKDGYARGTDAANRVDLGAKAMSNGGSSASKMIGGTK